MDGYSARNELLEATSQQIEGIVTHQAVSEVFTISSEGSRTLRVHSDVTVADSTGTVAFTLQSSVDKVSWIDHDAIADMGAGASAAKILLNNVFNGTDVPMGQFGRVTISTTHADDDVTVTTLLVLQSK